MADQYTDSMTGMDSPYWSNKSGMSVRTLTPEELLELERAQREGGIPNIVPDSSIRVDGDMQLRPVTERKLQGYPRGGVRGLLGRVGAGIQEDVGQIKDKAVGLLEKVDWPNWIRGGYDNADIPTEEQPEWLSNEWLSKETGVPLRSVEFFKHYKQAYNSGGKEAAKKVFDEFWPYLSPGEKIALNKYLYGVK